MRCRSRAGGGGSCGVWRLLVQWAALVAASGAALGHPHGRARAFAAQETLLAPKQARARDSPDEPSCDQLKAMWRFSKRQARAPEIMNDIPTYRDPFTFNEWPAYPVARAPTSPRYRETYSHGYRPRPQGPTYGRVVTKAPPGAVRYASYAEPDEIIGGAADDSSAANLLRFAGRVRVVNDPVPQIGRFQMLKQMIQKERAQDLQRQREADQQAARAAMLREIAAGNRGEDFDRFGYPEQEVRRLVEPDFAVADELAPKPRHRPSVAGRQFSRYSDSMPPPARRSPPMILRLHPMPYADYELNDPLNY